MARVSLIDEKDHPELAELVEKVRSGRRGNLLNLYRLLLHSPPLAASWFEHSNSVRWRTQLDGRLREIVIIRVAHLNGARYIVKQHVPALAEPEGLSAEECAALADWRATALFSPRERAVLAYADAMTRDIEVPDSVFDELPRHFNERQIVELTLLIAMYNMTTRFAQALRIDPEPSHS